MLTMEQLQDAERCHLLECFECKLSGEFKRPLNSCVERIAETALAQAEALKQAREALISSNQYRCGHCRGTYMNHVEGCLVKVALEAIDKIGGREDE